ncbi:hypothetical protein LINPERHAP2_LOCUS18120 [Linum perenne]
MLVEFSASLIPLENLPVGSTVKRYPTSWTRKIICSGPDKKEGELSRRTALRPSTRRRLANESNDSEDGLNKFIAH